jgi:hypothetical protein
MLMFLGQAGFLAKPISWPSRAWGLPSKMGGQVNPACLLFFG